MGRSPEEVERIAALRHAALEHWGHGGHWGRGGAFGGGRGRRRRGDVRQAILELLAEAPSNGYGLMQTIEERSGGRWRPSPGSVYPTLAQLDDEGLIRAAEADGTKLYELTDAGRERAAEAPESSWQCPDPDDGSPDLRALFGALGIAVTQLAQAGDRRQHKQAAEVLANARRSLYRILAEDDA